MGMTRRKSGTTTSSTNVLCQAPCCQAAWWHGAGAVGLLNTTTAKVLRGQLKVTVFVQRNGLFAKAGVVSLTVFLWKPVV